MSQFEAPRYECTKHVIHLNTEEIAVFDVLCSIASLFLARTIAGWFGHWVGSARNERCSSSPEISHVRRITHGCGNMFRRRSVIDATFGLHLRRLPSCPTHRTFNGKRPFLVFLFYPRLRVLLGMCFVC